MRKLAVGVFAAMVCMASLPFSVFADDPTANYIELSETFMNQVFSDATWYYADTNGGYSAAPSPYIFKTTASQLSLEGYTSDWWYTDSGQTSRDVYVCYWPAHNLTNIDYDDDWGFQVLTSFDIYFSNITHLDISCSLYPSYARRSLPAVTYSAHQYAQIGENSSQILHATNNFSGGSPDSQNFAISNYYMQGNTNNPPIYTGWSGCSVYNFDRASGSQCYLGEFTCCNGGRYRFSSDTEFYYYVVFSNIRVNTGYLYHGHSEPPPPVTTSPPAVTNITGSGTGAIVTNSSGGTEFNYNINVQVPDYNSVINPSYDSSRLDDMSSNMSEYHVLEDDLLGSAVDNLESLPDMGIDPDTFEDAEPIFDSFFDYNVIAIMVSWVCIISFISYVLFGKWV